MLKYFKGSYIFTILGFIAAYFWSQYTHCPNPLSILFIVLVLSILEISLSSSQKIPIGILIRNALNL